MSLTYLIYLLILLHQNKMFLCYNFILSTLYHIDLT